MVGFAIAFLATVFDGESLDLFQVNLNVASPRPGGLEVKNDVTIVGWNVQSLVLNPG